MGGAPRLQGPHLPLACLTRLFRETVPAVGPRCKFRSPARAEEGSPGARGPAWPQACSGGPTSVHWDVASVTHMSVLGAQNHHRSTLLGQDLASG